MNSNPDRSPQVSILVTVYNREEFLPACLESIQQSTFEDFEVVIVDDGSTDQSLELARNLSDSDGRFRVHRNETNLGQWANRNRAAALAKGDFLKYLDADDVIYPNSLAYMVEALAKCPNAGFAISHSAAEDIQPYPFEIDSRLAYHRHFLGGGVLNAGPSASIVRREAFEKSGGYSVKWGAIGDIELWLRLAAKAPVVLMPPALVWWRRHPGQAYTKGMNSGEYLEEGFALELEALTAGPCPLSESDRKRAIARVRQHHARRLLGLAIKQHKVTEALRSYRRSNLTAAELISGFRSYQ